MTEFTCSLAWKRAASDEFRSGKFNRDHSWQFDGGARVEASVSPEIVRAPYSDPRRVDPEEAFVAAISSCHMLTFLHLAARAGLIIDSYQDSPVGVLADDGSGLRAMVSVTLRPVIDLDPPIPQAQLDDLHAQAHELCFLARSIRTEISIEARQRPAASKA
jgi:organic hydroperoxide reductase OsmC/OhrA